MIVLVAQADQRVLPPWQVWEPVPVALVAVLGWLAASLVVVAAFGQGGVATIVIAILTQVSFVLATVGWVAIRHPGTVSSLGLRSARPAMDLLLGAFLGTVLYLATAFLLLPVIDAVWRLVTGSPPGPIDQGLLAFEPTGLELVLGMFAAVVAAPIGEEIFFRGFVFGTLRARLGFPRAAVISSALFAAVHVLPVVIVVMFFVGLALSVLYERRGSLVAPMGAHAFFNVIGYTLLVMERV